MRAPTANSVRTTVTPPTSPGPVGVTRTLSTSSAPAAISGNSHRSTSPARSARGLVPSSRAPAGTASSTTTPRTAPDPRFVSVIVTTNGSPGTAVAGASLRTSRATAAAPGASAGRARR